MPRDRLGNVLKTGDLVALKLPEGLSTGIIKEITLGGTILAPQRRGEQPQMTAGEIVITHEVRYLYDPTKSDPHIQELMKVLNPEQKKLV